MSTTTHTTGTATHTTSDIATYRWAGIGALILAVIFPIYWMSAFANLSLEALRGDFITFSGWDVLFVLVGALEVFIYLALAKVCRDQLEGAVSAVVLMVMAAMVAIFHATTIIDIMHGIGLVGSWSDTLVDVGLVASLVSLFLYTIAALVLSISLLVRFTGLPTLMRCFAIGLLIACVLQLTVILGIANVVLFPVLFLLLAVYFLRGEHSVEVV